MSGKWVAVEYHEYQSLAHNGKPRRCTMSYDTDDEGGIYEKWVEDKPEPTADLILYNNHIGRRDGDLYRWPGGWVTSKHLQKYGGYTELEAVPKKEWDDFAYQASTESWHNLHIANAARALFDAHRKLTND